MFQKQQVGCTLTYILHVSPNLKNAINLPEKSMLQYDKEQI